MPPEEPQNIKQKPYCNTFNKDFFKKEVMEDLDEERVAHTRTMLSQLLLFSCSIMSDSFATPWTVA